MPKSLKRDIKKQPTKPPKQVNKEKKPQEIEPKFKEDCLYRCVCCGYEYKKQDGNFYTTRSPMFKGNNGYQPYCKRCMSDIFEHFTEFFDGDEDAAIERVCQLTDITVNEEMWIASRKANDSKSRVGSYIAKLNMLKNQGVTYSDTIIARFEKEQAKLEVDRSAEATSEETGIPQEVIKRFGVGFEDYEYERLQAEYEDWIRQYGEPNDKHQRELYVTSCLMKSNLIESMQSKQNNVSAVANSYKNFLEAATIEIEDRIRKQKEGMETSPIGVMINDIERYTPAEYYKDKTLFTDFDKIKEYFSRFIYRPLKNLLTGTDDMDEEFSINSDEED